jgi:death-on-curing protein
MDFLQFVEWDELLTLHEQQLALYGGAQGFVDENSVRSVMSRPQFTSQYVPEADLADLAADYLFGFATTQGFSDGNKRTAVVAAERFLGKNGWRTFMSARLMYLVASAVARGELDRDRPLPKSCASTWKHMISPRAMLPIHSS